MAKKMKLTLETSLTFGEGVEEFLLSCEARNLRPGTIRHYQDSIKQIYKIVPKETPINEIDEDTWDTYKITLRKKATLNHMYNMHC